MRSVRVLCRVRRPEAAAARRRVPCSARQLAGAAYALPARARPERAAATRRPPRLPRDDREHTEPTLEPRLRRVPWGRDAPLEHALMALVRHRARAVLPRPRRRLAEGPAELLRLPLRRPTPGDRTSRGAPSSTTSTRFDEIADRPGRHRVHTPGPLIAPAKRVTLGKLTRAADTGRCSTSCSPATRSPRPCTAPSTASDSTIDLGYRETGPAQREPRHPTSRWAQARLAATPAPVGLPRRSTKPP
jgi:hypothetical protein